MSSAICDNSVLVQRGRNISLDRPQSNLEFTLGYYIFGHIFVLLCVLVWILFKNRFEWTRLRPTVFVVFAACASLAQMNFGSLQVLIADNHPCWLAPILMVMIVPFGSTAIIGRLLLFSFLSQFAQSASKAFQEATNPVTPKRDVHVSGDELGTELAKTSAEVADGDQSINWLQTFQLVSWKILFPSGQVATKQELHILRFLSSPKGVFTIAMVMIMPFLILSLVLLATDPVYTNCTNCVISTVIAGAVLVVMVIQSSVGIAYWCILHRFKAEDPWGLKSECFYSLIFVCVAFIGFILTAYGPGHTWPYSHQFMLSLGIWLFVMEQSLVQLYFGWKLERKGMNGTNKRISKRIGNVSIRLQQDSATQNEHSESILATLDMILATPELNEAFEHQLVSEYGVESLFFLRDVDTWKQRYHDEKSNTRVTRAKRIYKAYIQQSGLYAVNIPHEVGEHIRKELFKKVRNNSSSITVVATIEESNEDVPKVLFDEAYQEIRWLLANGAMRRFCKSPMYISITTRPASGLPLVTNGSQSGSPVAPESKRIVASQV